MKRGITLDEKGRTEEHTTQHARGKTECAGTNIIPVGHGDMGEEGGGGGRKGGGEKRGGYGRRCMKAWAEEGGGERNAGMLMGLKLNCGAAGRGKEGGRGLKWGRSA